MNLPVHKGVHSLIRGIYVLSIKILIFPTKKMDAKKKNHRFCSIQKDSSYLLTVFQLFEGKKYGSMLKIRPRVIIISFFDVVVKRLNKRF